MSQDISISLLSIWNENLFSSFWRLNYNKLTITVMNDMTSILIALRKGRCRFLTFLKDATVFGNKEFWN